VFVRFALFADFIVTAHTFVRSLRMPRFGINDSTHASQGTIITNVKGNRPAQV